VKLKHPNIQDMPLAHNKPVPAAKIPEIVEYNINDVDTQIWLYKFLLEYEIPLRSAIGKTMGVDVLSANDTSIAKITLNKYYTERAGISYNDLKDLRTTHHTINVNECIGKHIEFQTEVLQRLLGRLQDLVLEYDPQVSKVDYKNLFEYFQSNDDEEPIAIKGYFKYKETVEFDDGIYEMGVGGLHSADTPAIFKSDDEYVIMDADVTSYYPYIILNNEFAPAHLDARVFLELLLWMVTERVNAKNNNEAEKAQILKIAINSIFGLLGSEYYWLNDFKMLISTTISGQLYLLMLIEKLAMIGIKTISANTDGIVCKVPRNKLDEYHAACAEWATATDFKLEFTEYKKYVRRDVNNYITVKADGAKTKGIFDIGINGYISAGMKKPTRTILNKGYDAPVVSIALYEYFVNDVPVATTLKNHRDIYDFLISKRNSDKFECVLERVTPEGIVTLPQQKTNRYYASVSSDSGSLLKISKETGRPHNLLADRQVNILNKVVETDAWQYDIDYDYYIKRIQGEIDKIEGKTGIALFF